MISAAPFRELLFSDDRHTLWHWKAALTARLEALRLTPHPGAHPRPVSEGFPFLGFVVLPWRRRLKRRKVVECRRRFARLLAEYQAGGIPLSAAAASVRGWVNHTRYGNTIGLRKAVLSPVAIGRSSPRPVSGIDVGPPAPGEDVAGTGWF